MFSSADGAEVRERMDLYEEKRGRSWRRREHLPPPTVFISRVLGQGSGLGPFAGTKPAWLLLVAKRTT